MLTLFLFFVHPISSLSPIKISSKTPRSLVESFNSYLNNWAVRVSGRTHRRNLTPQPRTLNHTSANAKCGLKGWILISSTLGATPSRRAMFAPLDLYHGALRPGARMMVAPLDLCQCANIRGSTLWRLDPWN